MIQDATPSKPDHTNLLAALQAKVADLTCTSEVDYPFEVQYFDGFQSIDETQPTSFNTQTLLQLTGHDAGMPVEERDLQTFFAPMLERQDRYEAVELERVDRYQSLMNWLQTNLSDTKVYRVGEIEIDVYIIGKAPTHEWIGLSTKIVET